MKKLIVILAVIAMVGAFTATAMADVELYGSARFRTYYADVDSGIPGFDSDTDLEWRMGTLTRFGANFKSDKMTGKFELDARSGGAGATANIESGSQASGLGNMRLRHLWGEYDFGSMKLMIGQNFPLTDAPVSNIAYYAGGLQKFGGMGILQARTSQIRLTFGNLRLAFLPPDTAQTTPSATLEEVNTMFPKVELRYDMKLDNFALNFIGGWQTYEVEDRLNAAGTGPGSLRSEDINSYFIGARAKADFGPIYAGLGINYRVNGNNYGIWTATAAKETAIFQGNDLKDADAFGVVAALGWKFSDMFSVEASFASLSSEQDTGPTNEDDVIAYGLILPIKLAPGVMIQPEFIIQDNKDVVTNGVSSDQGDNTIIGVWWKIDFK
jgi:hypothetical protein